MSKLSSGNGNGNGEQLNMVYDETQEIPISLNVPKMGRPIDFEGKVRRRIEGVIGRYGETIARYKLIQSVRDEINNALYILGVQAEFRPDEVRIIQLPRNYDGEYCEHFHSA